MIRQSNVLVFSALAKFVSASAFTLVARPVCRGSLPLIHGRTFNFCAGVSIAFGPGFSVRSNCSLINGLVSKKQTVERDDGCSAIFHWITSFARSSSDCGMVMPSAFAVLRLTTNSNFVGCSTGISAGFAPLRILST